MLTSLLFSLLVGAIAGWIASKLVAGTSLGLGANIVVGMVGALVARWVLPFMGFPGGLLASIFPGDHRRGDSADPLAGGKAALNAVTC